MKTIILLAILFTVSGCKSQQYIYEVSSNGSSVQSVNDSTYYAYKKYTYYNGNIEEHHMIMLFKSGCNSFGLAQLYNFDFESLNIMAKKEYIENLSNLKDVNWFSTKEEALNSVKK